MRRLFFAVSLAALPSLLFAAQHTGTTAAAPAAAPAVHASAPPMRSAPSASTHSSGTHSSSVRRSSTGSHPGSPTRISNKPGSSPVKTSVAAPQAAFEFGLPPNPIAPIPSSLAYVNSVPTLLPFGQRCFGGFGCFGHNRHLRNTGFAIPWGDYGGFYLPIPYYEPYSDDQGEAAPDNVQASDQPDNTGNNDTENPRNEPAAEKRASANPDFYYPPSQPTYDFVFVKRDGTKIFAVAYSLSNDKLQYVTREGLRRTIPLDSLDFQATQKSNEERGNTVTLPTPPPSAMAAL